MCIAKQSVVEMVILTSRCFMKQKRFPTACTNNDMDIDYGLRSNHQ